MEYLWYIIASLGAGIGTGLAGLSAATVMVPILIVMCPSFYGTNGAYQATGIALASDILGSAVTTLTYIKYKNIDLKKGSVMLVCIVLMCTLGSYVAYLAGNVVLGSFTLFLTFCIGIRFLVKPDTSRKISGEKTSGLGLKEIAVSLFFGLTIGFGTGFVGTGGGMMMLIVFTVFLGMELKTAVGTSTFIMTFTALIASISHVIIHPSILFERWNVLLICIAVTTAASLVSAQFANRVKNRTVGLVTGAVLTVLGVVMIVLRYYDFLSKVPFFNDTLFTLSVFAVYILICLAVILPVRLICRKIPQFVFRKVLHLVAFVCVVVMIHHAPSWQSASISCLVLAAVIYPVLLILEKEDWFSHFFVEKSKGEIKFSMVILFVMYALLIAVTWGLQDKAWIGIASILMWGPGDAMAALIGIPFGKHKIKAFGGKKSIEGTSAMAITCFVFGFMEIYFFSCYSLGISLLLSFVTSIVASFVELVSPTKLDTITVPLSIVLVLSFVSLGFPVSYAEMPVTSIIKGTSKNLSFLRCP